MNKPVQIRVTNAIIVVSKLEYEKVISARLKVLILRKLDDFVNEYLHSRHSMISIDTFVTIVKLCAHMEEEEKKEEKTD